MYLTKLVIRADKVWETHNAGLEVVISYQYPLIRAMEALVTWTGSYSNVKCFEVLEISTSAISLPLACVKLGPVKVLVGWIKHSECVLCTRTDCFTILKKMAFLGNDMCG